MCVLFVHSIMIYAGATTLQHSMQRPCDDLQGGFAYQHSLHDGSQQFPGQERSGCVQQEQRAAAGSAALPAACWEIQPGPQAQRCFNYMLEHPSEAWRASGMSLVAQFLSFCPCISLLSALR